MRLEEIPNNNMNTFLKLKMLRGSAHKERIARRHPTDLSDCANLPDSYLLRICGVDRLVFHQILRILEPIVPQTQRSNGIPFPLKVFLFFQPVYVFFYH